MARLLLVDDESTLLALLRRYLERQGFEVATFTTAEAALASLEADSAFDVAVVDLTLPGMNGEDFLVALRKRLPSVPAFLASGYPYEPKLAGVGFLQKPFLPQDLADAIRKALG